MAILNYWRVYHTFHEKHPSFTMFHPEIAGNWRKNFRIMMPDIGKWLGGSLSNAYLTSHYIPLVEV